MKSVTITRCGSRSDSTYTYESLAAAIEAHRYTLETGRSYESERGNKKNQHESSFSKNFS